MIEDGDDLTLRGSDWFDLMAYGQRVQELEEREKELNWVFTDPLDMFINDKEITGGVFRIYFYMVRIIDSKNYINCTQAQIAKDLGLQRTNVSLAVRTLLRKGVITKVDYDGKTKYHLNTRYGWKNRDESFQNEKKEILKDTVVNLKDFKRNSSKINKNTLHTRY